VVLVLAGLLFLGGWRLGKELVRSEPSVSAVSILEFLFALGATWLAAGVITPILLWSIRPAHNADPIEAQRPPQDSAGLIALMPAFLALAALLAAAASGPVLSAWSEGLGLLERFHLWQELASGGEGLLAVLPIAAVLFVPAIGSATTLSFLVGTATAFTFQEKSRRFIRIYGAWLTIHAALVLAIIFSSHVVADVSGPWLEELRADVAAREGADATNRTRDLFYIEDWIPATVERTGTLATRATWISLVYAAWVPVLLLASRERFASSRRRSWRTSPGD